MKRSVLLIVFLVTLCVMTPALVENFMAPITAQPQAPCIWSGVVTCNGLPVPENTTVIARFNVIMYSSAMSRGAYMVMVPQINGVPKDGDLFDFYVSISGAEYFACSSAWEGNKVKTLDIDVDCIGLPPVVSPLIKQLESVLDKVNLVYGFFPGEGINGWTVYNPQWIEHPDWNTLKGMIQGRGYWLKVSEDCVLVSETWDYQLREGWNLIGWLDD